MTLSPAFWDSSALNPLCVREANSTSCRSLAAQFGLVVWWATPVEIRSAIARLQRSGSLNAGERQDSLDRLAVLQSEWREVLPNNGLRELAERLLDIYPLRAADSLQLAAALIWCRQTPVGRTFVSADLRLCEAATRAGFTVIQPKPSVP
jgi:predicted nucleic acid-binding protein